MTDAPLETEISGAALESIVRTEELLKRPERPPDYRRETRALATLVRSLADSPGTVLQTLADAVLEALQADSAGVSLLTQGEEKFYRAALAGAWQAHAGGGMPLADDALRVPFHVNGRCVGTLWAITRNAERSFDREDLRLLGSLGDFASAAYQAIESIESLRSQVVAGEQAESGLRQLAGSLEDQVRARTEALVRARAELAHAARLATGAELSAAIAHEVSQPLGAVAADAVACHRWLSAETPNVERARRSAERLVRDANAACEVVNRVRALYRHAGIEARAVDLNELIEQVLMLDEVSQHGVSIEVDLQRGLPLIPADRVQIQQVLVNLVRNGVEAIEAVRGAPGTVLIRSSSDGRGYVRVEVRDSGCGLQDLESVFKPFVTTKKTGMGMGLAICRTIVEAHEGRISARRNDDAGTTFTVELPLVLRGQALCAGQALGVG